MICFDKFKDGKSKIVTMSYDDSPACNRRLIELFDKYGIRGTFHLNSCNIDKDGFLTSEDLRKLCANHEVSCHMLHHPYPTKLPQEEIIIQTIEDRRNLERITGKIIKGMSYPYGRTTKNVTDTLGKLGIVYSRTVSATQAFDLPEDFMYWHPTCHHDNANKCIDAFLKMLDRKQDHHLLYIWGHAHEFKTEEDWQYIENICKRISGLDDVWYATNIEIYNYVTALKRLEVSADTNIVHNPSAVPVWISRNGQTVEIPAGQTVTK